MFLVISRFVLYGLNLLHCYIFMYTNIYILYLFEAELEKSFWILL